MLSIDLKKIKDVNLLQFILTVRYSFELFLLVPKSIFITCYVHLFSRNIFITCCVHLSSEIFSFFLSPITPAHFRLPERNFVAHFPVVAVDAFYKISSEEGGWGSTRFVWDENPSDLSKENVLKNGAWKLYLFQFKNIWSYSTTSVSDYLTQYHIASQLRVFYLRDYYIMHLPNKADTYGFKIFVRFREVTA